MLKHVLFYMGGNKDMPYMPYLGTCHGMSLFYGFTDPVKPDLLQT